MGKLSFLMFFFLNCYWSIVALQCCVSFYCAAKWINYPYTYILSLFELFLCRSPQGTEFPELYSGFSLVIYFIHSINSMHMSIPISPFIPPPLSHLEAFLFLNHCCWTTHPYPPIPIATWPIQPHTSQGQLQRQGFKTDTEEEEYISSSKTPSLSTPPQNGVGVHILEQILVSSFHQPRALPFPVRLCKSLFYKEMFKTAVFLPSP